MIDRPLHHGPLAEEPRAPLATPSEPEHRDWLNLALKRLAEVRFSSVDKKTVDEQTPVRLCNYTDVYYNDRITSDMPFMDASATTDQVEAFTLRAGDVLLTKDSETADDIGVSAYVAEDLPGVLCGYHLALARPNGGVVDGRYLRWAMVSTHARQQLEVGASGVTRFGLRQDAVGGMVLPVPSLIEQRAIADYLDAETARIDGLMSARRAQIEILRSRLRAAIDQELATVRSTWRLKHLLAESLEYGAAEPADTDDPTWPRYIRTTDFDDEGKLRPDTFRSLPPAVARPFLLRDGDLLLTRSGATVGKSLRWRGEWGTACFAGYLIRARPDPARALPDYVAYFLRSSRYWDEIGLTTIQATIQNVSAEKYGEIRVPAPPVREQQAIVDRLNRVRDDLRAVTSRVEAQVDLLRERRQALITAAVSGQLDILPGVAE